MSKFEEEDIKISAMREEADQISMQMVGQLNQLHNEMDNVLYGLKAYDGLVESQTLRSSQEKVRARKHVQPRALQFLMPKSANFQVKINKEIQQLSFPANLICMVCLEPYQKPATLPCEHTFCALCLLRCSQLWSPKMCPLCGQEYSRFPNVNMTVEQAVFKIYRSSWQACVGDIVRTLASDEQSPAYSFGIVDSMQNGYVSTDMMTLVVEDLGNADDFESEQFLETKIAGVNLGTRKWEGKVADTEAMRANLLCVGTRLMRGGLIINSKYIKRQDVIVGQSETVEYQLKQSPKLKIPVIPASEQRKNRKEATPEDEINKINEQSKTHTNDDAKMKSTQFVSPKSQVESLANKAGMSTQLGNDNREDDIDANEILGAVEFSKKPKEQQMKELQASVTDSVNEDFVKEVMDAQNQLPKKNKTVIESKGELNQLENGNEEPSLLNEIDNNIDITKPVNEMLEDMAQYSHKFLAKEFVFDPLFPKQQPVIYSPYTITASNQLCILLSHESVTNKHLAMDMKQNTLNIDQTMQQYVALITDFQYLQKCPHFCCNGCKMLLRVPVVLPCGCQYCMQCAIQLQKISLDCLGCGKPITKKVSIKTINKQLTLQLYSKLPRHSPMIDRGLPVKVADKIGLLLDDPNRVNVWVMLSKTQNSYVHFNDLTAINLCNAQTAIRASDGIVYFEGQFYILSTTDDKNLLYSVDIVQGIPLTEQDVCYKCLRLVEDLREQIVVSKIEGSKILQTKRENLIKQMKRKISEQKKQEILNAKMKPRATSAKKKLDQQTIERRKKLNLVGMDNPNAANHPGNIMVYNSPGVQKSKFEDGIKASDIAQRLINSKPPLIQMCYLYPKLNFLCSACWGVLKRPVQLPCGHIVCRTCCCVYQSAGMKCLLCHTAVGSVLDCPFDQKLHQQLMLTEEKYSLRGLDVGCFVSQISDPQLGIVIKSHFDLVTHLTVCYPENIVKQLQCSSQNTKSDNIAQLEFKKVLEDDLCLGAPCMVVVGKCKGVMGLITAVPEQQSEICMQVRVQLGVESDALVLEVRLETGVGSILPLNYLRKIEVVLGKKQYKDYAEEKQMSEQIEQDEIKQIAENELQDEEDKKAGEQQVQKEVVKEEVDKQADVWKKPAKFEKKRDYKGF